MKLNEPFLYELLVLFLKHNIEPGDIQGANMVFAVCVRLWTGMSPAERAACPVHLDSVWPLYTRKSLSSVDTTDLPR